MTAAQNTPTTGKNRAQLDKLYRRTRTAINAAYAAAESQSDASRVLRDYAEDRGTQDRFENLERLEQVAEREHRGFGPDWQRYHARISVNHAAHVMLLHNIGMGASLMDAPSAAEFMTCRRGAVEAMAVGYFAREAIRADVGLGEALRALDYAAVVSLTERVRA